MYMCICVYIYIYAMGGASRLVKALHPRIPNVHVLPHPCMHKQISCVGLGGGAGWVDPVSFGDHFLAEGRSNTSPCVCGLRRNMRFPRTHANALLSPENLRAEEFPSPNKK